MEIYSFEPRPWTKQEFVLIEWVAAQCFLAMEIARLQQELRTSRDQLRLANAHVEAKVQERTAKL